MIESFTFGVEIETTIPNDAPFEIGQHGQGIDIPQLPGWKADREPSIRVTELGRQACEFVSPVYRGSAGLQQCLVDLATIRGFGAKVNASCGLHVHVGFDKTNAELVARMLTLVANLERAIYASTGSKTREQGRWCGSVRANGAADSARRANNWNRYYLCNFNTRRPTVEFRAFGSTLNGVKLAAYVAMCLGIVERAIRAKRRTNWTPRATNIYLGAGEGEQATRRLFYLLGWTKGRQDHVHGHLQGDGIPTIDRMKEELIRLSRKYDTPEPALILATTTA